MMKKLFRKLFKPKTEVEDLTWIAKETGPLIDKSTAGIFAAYRDDLINREISYIVPAIWGIKQNGELDETQKEIYEKVNPVVEEVISMFASLKDCPAEKYALYFLVRGLFVSKMAFQIETYKKLLLNQSKLWDVIKLSITN